VTVRHVQPDVLARWEPVVGAVGSDAYVEEDQEEEGQDAPLEGESWQAPQHGSLTNVDRSSELISVMT